MPVTFLTNEDKEELKKMIAQMGAGGSSGGSGATGAYVLTDADKAEIAEMASKLVPGSSMERIAEIELIAANWAGDVSPYSQVVDVPGVTMYSQVDLTPSVEQLAIFHNKDLAFVAENEDGVVTVYAIGDKPANDYTMQVTIKEVSV